MEDFGKTKQLDLGELKVFCCFSEALFCLLMKFDQNSAVPIPVPTSADTVTRPGKLFNDSKTSNHPTY